VKPFSYAIALTGSIATGKSTVAEIFAGYGFPVIDADRIAHQILDKQAAQIAALFGQTYIVQGKVDRKALGRLIFSDTQKRQELEHLLHPLIQEEIQSQAKSLDTLQKPYLVDIPLFFEHNRYPISRVIVVYTPRHIQLERLVQREGYTLQEAQRRIDTQMDIEQKRSLATWVIDNSGDRRALEAECQRVKDLIFRGALK